MHALWSHYYLSYKTFSLWVTLETKIFPNFLHKSNFLGNYRSDQQTSKIHFPHLLTLFEVVVKHYLIRPTQFVRIEKKQLQKMPGRPCSEILMDFNSRIMSPRKKNCEINYLF